MESFTTCLWFDGQAEEAAKFYTSIFKNSRTLNSTAVPDAGQEVHGREKGTPLTVSFEINGHKFMGLNGGPYFKFNEAISFVITCKDQAEVDYYWEHLSSVPEAEQCGWVKDKFGVSWQIVPKQLYQYMNGPQSEHTKRVMNAMLKMKKIIISELDKAYKEV